RIAKEKPRPLDGAEQVAHHRKSTAFDARVKNRRPARRINAPLNLRHLQARIDFRVQTHELLRALQIGDAFAATAVSHQPNSNGVGVPAPKVAVKVSQAQSERSSRRPGQKTTHETLHAEGVRRTGPARPSPARFQRAM